MRYSLSFFRTALTCALLCLGSLPAASPWQPASWGGSETFLSVTCHPKDQTVVWAVTLKGGVLRSTNLGDSWQWANGDLGILQGVRVVPDPSDTQGAYFVSQNGIWRTTSGGNHWELLPGTGEFAFTTSQSLKPFVISREKGTLFAGTARGRLFQSKDRGKSWKKVIWPAENAVRAMVEIPAFNTLIIAASGSSGLYRYEPEKGGIPSLITTSPPHAVKDLLVDPAPPYELYAVCGKHGLWKAERYAKQWERVELEGTAQNKDLQLLASSGKGRNRLLFACARDFCLRSADGKEWTKVLQKHYFNEVVNPTRSWYTKPSHPTGLCGGTSRDVLFLSDFWSLHRTNNASGNARWAEVVKGAGNQVINDLAVGANARLFAAGNKAGVLSSTDLGDTYLSVWPEKYGKDVGDAASVAVTGDNTLIAASINWWQGTVQAHYGKSKLEKITAQSKGLNGERMFLSPAPEPRGPWAIAPSPAKKNRAYLLSCGETSHLYLTDESGRSWTLRHLPAGAKPYRALAADYERPGRLYLGSLGKPGILWISEDAGLSWKTGLRAQQGIADVCTAPGGTVYVLGEKGTFWRSSTRAIAWEKKSDTGVSAGKAICTDPTGNSRLFAAGTFTVRTSPDKGNTWERFGAPPPRIPEIRCMAFDPVNGILFIGTDGAGVWRIDGDR